jgi:hypothetical protein
MIWQRMAELWGDRLEPEPPDEVREPPSDPVALGHAAQALLHDPVMRLALDRVERRLIDTWRQSAMGALQEREAAYHLHGAVQELRAELGRMVADGRRRAAG